MCISVWYPRYYSKQTKLEQACNKISVKLQMNYKVHAFKERVLLFFISSVACAKVCVRVLRAFAEGKPEGLKKLLISIPF